MAEKSGAPINNTVVLCIDRRADSDYSGRLYHLYTAEPIPFVSLVEAELLMDRFYDELGFPQFSTGTTLFRSLRIPGNKARKEMTVMASADSVSAKKGDIATFVIHVQHRQNATWQGNIVWADNKTESTFHSALELVKLIDMALENPDCAPGE